MNKTIDQKSEELATKIIELFKENKLTHQQANSIIAKVNYMLRKLPV